jgi:hypothetical protein
VFIIHPGIHEILIERRTTLEKKEFRQRARKQFILSRMYCRCGERVCHPTS